MKTCSFCWRDNEDNALKCSDCGKPLSRADSRPAQEPVFASVRRSRLEAACKTEPAAGSTLVIKRTLLVAGALVLLTALWLVVWSGPRDKLAYRGKHLQAWLGELHPFGQEPTLKSLRAAAAIKHIGSNAVPLLLVELQAHVGLKRDRDEETRMDAFGRADRAIVALIILGTNAHSAIPELLDLLIKDETHFVATATLCGLREKGVEAIASKLTDVDPSVRLKATKALRLGVAASQPAISGLLAALEDTDANVRAAAIRSLGFLVRNCCEPEPYVSYLLARFQLDTDLEVRITAADVLGDFGGASRSAVSTILAALADYNEQSLRIAASRALRRIDPKRASEAEKTYPTAFEKKGR